MTSVSEQCSEPGCERPAYARGLCEPAYRRAKRAGRIDEYPPVGHHPEPPSLEEQLAARGWEVVGQCWLLHGSPNADGYLYVCNGGRRLTAPRAAWECWNGPVPGGRYVSTTTECAHSGHCISPRHLTLRTINRRVCARRGCSNPHAYKDLCHSHYKEEEAARQVSGAECLLPDCARIQVEHGLCSIHLTRAARSGYSLDLLPNALLAVS